jgi:YVTN family beta-propeller protein
MAGQETATQQVGGVPMSDSTLTATQLAVELGNAPEAPETIYLSEEAAVNKLTLAVTPDAEATLAEGQPVPRSEAKEATGSLLYLDLRNLGLSKGALEALKVTAPGWASLIDPAGYVCLAPEKSVTLPAKTPLEVSIDGLAIAKAPAGGSVQLYLVVFRVSGVTSGNVGLPWAFKSLLAEPPSGEADLHGAISLQLSGNVVVSAKGPYAGFPNAFSFSFLPGPKQHNVKAGPKTKFEVTFVYASADDPDGYGALCTTKQAKAAHLVGGQEAAGWHVIEPKDEQNPTWTLEPPSGKAIVGPQSTVSFQLKELVTQLRGGPTLMLVSYKGIPGYEDGAYALLLRKVEHATIKSFEIVPNPTVLKDGVAKVTLKWKTENAEVASITGIGPVADAEEGEEAVEILETTNFTLTAEAPPNARNSSIRTETATVLPVIDSFEADPEAIAADDFPAPVKLSWNVATKGKVRLTSSTDGKFPNEYGPAERVPVDVNQPQMVTLVPEGAAADPLIRRSVILSAFTHQLSKQPLAQAPSCVAASPTGAFVVVGSPTASGVTALDTMTYQPIGTTIPTAQGSNDLAFSADGSMLYVACAAKAIAPISVKATGAMPQYEFTNLGNFALTAEPRRIAIAPSGKYVYVTTAAGELEVLGVEAGGALTPLTTLKVGTEPEGVAVLPTGAQVYVANAGSNTVTLVGVSASGHHEVVNTIKVAGGPTGVEATADGKVLLVACRKSGKVEARSVEFPGAVGRSLTAGAGACDVALVPGGRYAVVAAKDAGTLALLGLGETPGTCSVVEAEIKVGPGPVGLSVTPEAGLVLAATGGEAALSVLTLAQYAETDAPVAAGAMVTDVVVRPDGGEAIVWHDARRSFRGESSTGVFAYDLRSLEVTPQLGNQEVIDFAYLPTGGSKLAFALTKGNSFIEVIDTTTWKPAGAFDLSALTAGSPRSLAVAADGSTLFALAGDKSNAFDLVALAVAADGTLTPIGKAVRVFVASRATLGEVAAAPDGSRAYVLDEADQQLVFVAKGAGGYAVDGEPVALGVNSIAFDLAPDGRRLYVLSRPSGANALTAVDTSTRAKSTLMLSSLQYSSMNGLVVSPDNSKVLITDGTMVGVRILDARSLRLIQTISFEKEVFNPFGVAVTPTGTQIFTANVKSNNVGVAQQVQPIARVDRGTEKGGSDAN